MPGGATSNCSTTEVVMWKIAALAVMMCFLGLTARAAAKGASVTGWISDSKCGAKGANAGHAACAQKCVDAGKNLSW